MKLISATPSPFARKVRIALAEKGIEFELVTDNPWQADATAPGFNPLGKIPVLILDDGSTVYDSRLILEFLETRYPRPPLLPADPDERFAAKRLEVLADGICDAVVLIVLERSRPADRQDRGWIDRQCHKVESGVAAVAQMIHGPMIHGPMIHGPIGERPWALPGGFSLADIAVGSMLGYLDLRFPEFSWRARYPGLGALADLLSERPSFKLTVPKAQAIPGGA